MEYGIWTQQGQVLCPTCAEAVGEGMKQQMNYAYYQSTCDHCRKAIWVEESIGMEQKLVYKARQYAYPESYLAQTGGMCHAAEINFVDNNGRDWMLSCIYCINPDDPGDAYWFTELYNPRTDQTPGRMASSIDEILRNIKWMQMNCRPLPEAKWPKAAEAIEALETAAGWDSSK